METTVGKILLKSVLPKDMHPLVEGELDKKGINQLFTTLAEKHPTEYGDITSKITRLGFEVSTRLGSSVGLNDLNSPVDKDAAFKRLDDLLADLRKKKLPKKEYVDKANEVYQKFIKDLGPELIKAGVDKDHILAKITKAGARGSVSQYMQTIFAPVLVQDNKGNPLVDMPIRHSYAEGLSLPEYLSSGFGARAGLTSVKLATADSGAFCLSGETLVQMADFSAKAIKDIEPGEMVIGADKEGNTFPVKVINKFNNGDKEIRRYSFRDGESRLGRLQLDCTPGHKILASYPIGVSPNRFYDVMPISTARNNFAGVPIKSYQGCGVNDPYALILGMLIGDGGLTGASTYLSSGDPEAIEELNGLISGLDLRLEKVVRASREGKQEHEYRLIEDSADTCYTRDEAGHVITGTYKTKIKRYLVAHNVAGKHSYEKEIPQVVWSWDNSSIAELLAGIFSTDGCVSWANHGKNPLIFLGMTAENVVSNTRELLLKRFGIVGSTVKRLRIAGRTNKTLSPKISNKRPPHSNHDLFYFTVTGAQNLIKFQSHIRLLGIKGRKLKDIVDHVELKKSKVINYKLLSSEPLGLLPTYDIEVDHPDHLFVLANGLIVSNSKQLSRGVITEKVEEHDCGTDNGIDVPTADKDYIGSYLARPVASYNKNNEVTGKMLNDLKNKHIDHINVRSPITCQASRHYHSAAVCQLCTGKREKGLPQIGDYVGITAMTGLGESLSQGSLSAKHSSGSASGPKTSTGFSLVKQLASIPQLFKDKAAVAQHDGKITDIKDAPQGGVHIHVDKTEHYAPAGFNPLVKVGDNVEAGDVLSQGIPNPAEITHLKGIGEGRVHFTKAVKDAFDSGGMGGINRRNFELLSKSLIDHVRIVGNEPVGDHLPGEIASYQAIERSYVPRVDSADTRIDSTYGKYLEKPVLHYTIGTKVSKSIIENLKKHGITSIVVNDKAAPFQPEMQRLDSIPSFEADWMTQLYSTQLERKLLHAVNTGAWSDTKGPSPVPGLAVGVGFGEKRLKRAEDINE